MLKTKTRPQLGLKENWPQFSLLVAINAFVGAMVGLERSVIPTLAEEEFGLVAKTAIFSFIMAFGTVKALTNYFAGRFSDRWGRKKVLIGGWLVTMPVPFLIIYSSSWSGIILANVLLGVGQGLTWSTTVIMKIDLVGPKQRGLAMGLNEFAGYLALAGSALATGYLAQQYGPRPEPFYLGFAYLILGLFLSLFFLHETKTHVELEASSLPIDKGPRPSDKKLFMLTSFTHKNLSSVVQAGFVNNLNDGMAWGLFPLFYTSHGLDLKQVGQLAAVYPAVWGILQLWSGHFSDQVGRKWPIVFGMWIQALGIGFTMAFPTLTWFYLGAIFLGLGTALVYPTLLAAIGDETPPAWRATSVGIYRFWRDLGYPVGALLSGVVADKFGLSWAMGTVALMTFLSGVVTALRMKNHTS